MVNDTNQQEFLDTSTGTRYTLVAITEPVVKARKPRIKKKSKEFKAYGSLYKEDGDKIMDVMHRCIYLTCKQWGTSDVVRGIIVEYLKKNPDLAQVSADLVIGCYNK